MIVLVLALLSIVTAGALVVAYVAYPQRGHAIPRAGRLSRALDGLVDRVGLDPDDDEAMQGGHLTELRERRRTSVQRTAVRAPDGSPLP